MLAEFFYPTELKKMIRNLEAADNLRRDPLKYFNLVILIFLIWSCVAILILVNSGLIGFFLALFSIWVLFFPDLLASYQMIRAYVAGEKQKVKVIKFYPRTIRFHGPLFSVKCQRIEDGKIIKVPWISGACLTKNNINVGDEIFVYYSDDHGNCASPDIDDVKKELCLRKNLIHED